MRGKKPTVDQRNALKRKVKEDWVNWLYLKTVVENVGEYRNDELKRDTIKETFYVFINKETKECLKIPVHKKH